MADAPLSPHCTGANRRRLPVPAALCGFLILLALLFSVSYAVGSAAGPVAPGMHGTGRPADGGSGGGMGDMPGMGHGGGE
ncbi:hypothetical protein KUM39_20375 [Streptomyces sp. J2-1]|uniref:hypothetical protein n=1 Tax=Streptomyces corallincola TaxID=2851888 RepID=UPI001C382088|nr:hypothetical protein [Streptomyces corallincola]MBV2356702.1 hypothetical protein [Streptomyces corallincola]